MGVLGISRKVVVLIIHIVNCSYYSQIPHRVPNVLGFSLSLIQTMQKYPVLKTRSMLQGCSMDFPIIYDRPPFFFKQIISPQLSCLALNISVKQNPASAEIVTTKKKMLASREGPLFAKQLSCPFGAYCVPINLLVVCVCNCILS